MSTGVATYTRWICDNCQTEVRTASLELPPRWITFSTNGIEDNDEMHALVRHFCGSDHLARWLEEHVEVRIGREYVGAGDEPRKLGAVVRLDGLTIQRIWGCSSCGTKDDHHVVGCTLVR